MSPQEFGALCDQTGQPRIAAALFSGDMFRTGAVMLSFHCILPMPPTTNNLFPSGKNGRRFKSKEYELWLAKASFGFVAPHLSGKFRLTLELYFADKRRRDISNYEKAVTDFLVSRAVIDDDYLIDELHLFRRNVLTSDARVEVLLEVL